MSNTIKTLLARTGLAFGALVLALVLLEFVVRLLGPGGGASFLYKSPTLSPHLLYAEDLDLGLVPKPGAEAFLQTLEYATTVRFNAHGLRGPEIAEKEDGELRILTLGDSFTLATQVEEEDGFQAKLAKLLEERLEARVQVFNAGVDGYGTVQERIRLEQLGETTGIDAAVVVFFLGNDFTDNCLYPGQRRTRERIQAQGISVLPDLPKPGRVALFFHQNSVLMAQFQLMRKRRQLGAGNANFEQSRYRKEVALYSTGESEIRRQLHCTSNAFDDLAQACSTLDIPCTIALAPPLYMVDEGRLPKTFEFVGLDPATANPDQPVEALHSILPEGLAMVDMTPVLAAESPAPYFRIDGHWNSRGHTLVAETLADHLQEILPAMPDATP